MANPALEIALFGNVMIKSTGVLVFCARRVHKHAFKCLLNDFMAIACLLLALHCLDG